MQKQHLAKELSEILINVSSHSGQRIKNCTLLHPDCFVFDTNAGWNDAKIDLFYLAVVSELDVVPLSEAAAAYSNSSVVLGRSNAQDDRLSRFSLQSAIAHRNEVASLVSDHQSQTSFNQSVLGPV